MFRFSIRDVLILTILIAVLLGGSDRHLPAEARTVEPPSTDEPPIAPATAAGATVSLWPGESGGR